MHVGSFLAAGPQHLPENHPKFEVHRGGGRHWKTGRTFIQYLCSGFALMMCLLHSCIAMFMSKQCIPPLCTPIGKAVCEQAMHPTIMHPDWKGCLWASNASHHYAPRLERLFVCKQCIPPLCTPIGKAVCVQAMHHTIMHPDRTGSRQSLVWWPVWFKVNVEQILCKLIRHF